MQVTVIKNDELDFEAKIVIPADKIANKIQKKLETLSKKFVVKGFRVGKAPPQAVEKEYKLKVRYDIIHEEVNDAIEHVKKEYQLNPLAEPKIEIVREEDNEDLEFILKFELLPKINLPNFKDITIIRPRLVLKTEEINEQVHKFAVGLQGYTTPNMDKAENGHQVTIDAIGYINDQPFKDGQITNYKLVLGSNSFVGTFEEQLVGTKVGDEVEVHITFPEDYHMKEVAAKLAKFIVQVKEVHLPDEIILEDELAKKFDYDTLEDFRQAVSDKIVRDVSDPIHTMMKMNLFNQLEQMLTFNVPASLVATEINLLKKRTNPNDGEDSIFQNKTEQEIEEYYNKLAIRRVKIGLMLSEYVQTKKLTLQIEDLEKAIIAKAKNFPGKEAVIFEYYKKNPKALGNLKGPVLEEKAVQCIFDTEVTLTEEDYSMSELEEFLTEGESHSIL